MIEPTGTEWREKIDPYERYQSRISMADLFPDMEDGRCGCGCGVRLRGRRRRWASDECADAAGAVGAVIRGNASWVRVEVQRRDGSVCAGCGERKEWEADHVVPVSEGGGGCDINGYQTMCLECHKAKTAAMRGRQVRERGGQWDLFLR